ncbi:hypothetical protein [Diaphorobacter aerolatus]|uniref:Uncharacterized protein n=1 Tax=Diaphorobacter aerolatus TaxID=1288495 RepID=A0A7H0GJF6_9BURK|nr:hypothetical protein [Diaphorobacter aerolatus]QNP48422.1 hypothetical protein H9K75_21130 [Diaphorobacter aerolatus]
MPFAIRSLFIAFPVFVAGFSMAASAVEPSDPRRDYADTMMLCNAHTLLLQMYAKGDVPARVPKPANYRDLAYQIGGKEYVQERIDSSAVRDLALGQLEDLLKTKPYGELTEKERDDHTYAAWTSILNVCNERALKRPRAATRKK